jgi:hypothetical protein
VAKTITIDALNLSGMYVVQTGKGQYEVNAAYSLLSGTQVVLSVNQDVTASLDPNTISALSAAFAAVQAALAQVATL